MIAICKREIRSYFSSPVGYVCIAALAARALIKQRKRGGGCDGDCGHCGGCH